MYLRKDSRSKLGKQIDNYLRDNIQDEEIFWGVWSSMGMPDEALEEYRYQVDNGKIDFSDMELIDSEDVAEEMEE